jgi:glycosyltransferase involved in cell wall biosynthesis
VEGYEVVVVDDGSSDDTVPWLRDHAAALPHVRLICQEHGGPAEGRNRGVQEASGDVIVFIDSDLVVTPTFLGCHASALAAAWRRRATCAGARTRGRWRWFRRKHSFTPGRASAR